MSKESGRRRPFQGERAERRQKWAGGDERPAGARSLGADARRRAANDRKRLKAARKEENGGDRKTFEQFRSAFRPRRLVVGDLATATAMAVGFGVLPALKCHPFDRAVDLRSKLEALQQ